MKVVAKKSIRGKTCFGDLASGDVFRFTSGHLEGPDIYMAIDFNRAVNLDTGVTRFPVVTYEVVRVNGSFVEE